MTGSTGKSCETYFHPMRVGWKWMSVNDGRFGESQTQKEAISSLTVVITGVSICQLLGPSLKCYKARENVKESSNLAVL